MGTRTYAYMQHDFKASDLLDLPARFNRDVLAVSEVEDYWQAKNFDGLSRPSIWQAEWDANVKVDVQSMRDGIIEIAGGSSTITVYPHIASVFMAARWRGFLTIQRMRYVYRRLVHQIAETIGSSEVIWVPDYFERGVEIAAEGGLLNDISSALTRAWGQPQERLDPVSPQVIAETDKCPPSVWFTETSPYSMVSQDAGDAGS